MRDGPLVGLGLIEDILARDDLSDYHLLHAARADLADDWDESKTRRRPMSERSALYDRSQRGGFEQRLRDLPG